MANPSDQLSRWRSDPKITDNTRSLRSCAKRWAASASTISKFESGTRFPTLDQAFLIQDETGITARSWCRLAPTKEPKGKGS